MTGASQKKYQQRRPETTVLYRVIQQHLESFVEHAHESSGKQLPKYVETEFRRYLEWGLHAHGFARAVCEACGDELLLPFSCKRRGICPSCNTRVNARTARPAPTGPPPPISARTQLPREAALCTVTRRQQLAVT